MEKTDNRQDVPIGLTFQLAMNEEALERYAEMKPEEKQRLIEQAKVVSSKEEMHRG